MPSSALARLEQGVVACERCPRLRSYCRKVATEKRAAFCDQTYRGLPVPGFGDPSARIVVVGLAPAAHGANRTGRMFTGDRSGDFLYAALHRAGLANQPTSISADDGLRLSDVFITAAVRCAPPDNKPLPDERANCLPWLQSELELLDRAKVFLVLGQVGHDALVAALRQRGEVGRRDRLPFVHGAVHLLPSSSRAIVCSYHVSQQNTFTGRLTPAMFDRVLDEAKRLSARA
jgi:uracil-DNA glycosylase family 4